MPIKLTAVDQTDQLCEDYAAMMHRYIVRLKRHGIDDPLTKLARRAMPPAKRVRAMYDGAAPDATIRDLSSVTWVYEELMGMHVRKK